MRISLTVNFIFSLHFMIGLLGSNSTMAGDVIKTCCPDNQSNLDKREVSKFHENSVNNLKYLNFIKHS